MDRLRRALGRHNIPPVGPGAQGSSLRRKGHELCRQLRMETASWEEAAAAQCFFSWTNDAGTEKQFCTVHLDDVATMFP